MQFIRTLNQVQFTEINQFGTRACDLAKLHAERVPVPTTLVITADGWKFFVQKNNLQYKIDFILKQVDLKNEKTLVNAYNSVRKLLVNSPVPDALVAEIREAYESLGTGVAFDEMQKEDGLAFVTMLSSPNFAAPAESFEGIVQNIRGFDEVLLALKEIYAMMYTPQAIKYRAELKKRSFESAVIMQSMVGSVASATAYSSDPEHPDRVFIHTYKGYSDLRDVVAKDFFHVKKDFLSIMGSQIVEQTKIIVRKEDGQFYAEEFQGRDQSINDKQVIEVARLAKKSEKAVEMPLKLFYSITDTEFFVLFANRYALPAGTAQKTIEQEPMPSPEPVAAAVVTPEPEPKQEEVPQDPVQEVVEEEAVEEFEPIVEEPQEVPEAIVTPEEAPASPSPTQLEEYAASKMAQGVQEEPVEEQTPQEVVYEESQDEDSDDEVEESADEAEDEVFYEEDETQELAEGEDEVEYEDADGEAEDDSDAQEVEDDEEYEYVDVDEDGNEIETEEDDDEDVEYEDDDSEDDADETEDDAEEGDEDDTESEYDDEETDDEEYEYVDVDEDGNEIETEEDDTEDSNEEGDDEEYEYEDDDSEEDSDETEDDAEEGDEDETEYEEDDSDEDDGEEDTDDEEYDEDVEEDDTQDEVEEETHKTFEPQTQEPQEEPEQEEETQREMTKAEIKEAAQEINENFRLIYAQLVKRYEAAGNTAPDTITELIQKGTQEGVFDIDNLHEALAIKKKARSGEEITMHEKNLVLDILNKLM